VEQVTAGPHEVLDTALAIADRGCEDEPDSPRWWLASGLGHARAGFHADAAEAFAKARGLAPDRPGFVLGHGLSLQLDGKDAEAVPAFEDAVRLAESHPDRGGALVVAARFALARSQAKDRHWQQAAESLGAVLDHPLIRSSKRVGQPDVAQSMAVFFALAGLKERVTELVRRFSGKISGAIGDVLAGLVQAEAGAYADASETLGRAHQADPNPEVRKLLVACLLAAAAEAIKAAKPERASALVAKAGGLAPDDPDAARLADAVAVYLQLQRLDPAQLDNAIAQCEKLMTGDKPSAQLVRSLAVLYHRKAVEAERANKSPDKVWDRCVEFWKANVLAKDGFWDQFATEYNLGKGRREQLKSDDVAGWRKTLPGELAGGHAACLEPYLRANDKSGVKRHLRLVGEWDPGFEPPEGFFGGLAVKELSEDVIGTLDSELKRVTAPKFLAALEKVIVDYWFAKLLQHAERAGELRNRGISELNALAERLQQAGGPDPYLAIELRTKLPRIRGWLRDAKKELDAALGYLSKARKRGSKDESLKTVGEAMDKLSGHLRDDIKLVGDLCSKIGV
jgi:tetratricopeptide (TPR) repeat protein